MLHTLAALIAMTFPRDDGKHTSAAAEWWRVSARVSDSAGARYGVSAVFGRSHRPDAPDTYSATVALIDVNTGSVRSLARFDRDLPGLASASEDGLNVTTGDWRLWTAGEKVRHPSGDRLRLHVTLDGVVIDLLLQRRKPRVVFGPGDYAMTRLPATGRLSIDGKTASVSGLSWFGHEFGAAPPQVWDRFEVQFDDGRDLMLRTFPDASKNYGAVVQTDGTFTLLKPTEFKAENTMGTTWMSTRSGITYPIAWNLLVPSAALNLVCQPAFTDQEIAPPGQPPFYWGLIDVERYPPPGGNRGAGFVELVRNT